MIYFILGNLFLWTAGLGLGLLWGWQIANQAGDPTPGPSWIMVIFPPLAAWLTAETVNLVSPRRLFDRRSTARVGRALAGMFAGALGFGAAVLLLPVVDATIPDWATLAVASGLGTLIPMVLLSRMRRGHCAFCDYDLRALPSMRQCPECGRTDVL